MSKDETNILKGVAILMMLFLHLFDKMENVALTTPLLYLYDIPLVHILTRATQPVPFYLIISGYGLGYVYHHSELNLTKQFHRLSKLYITYFIFLLICAILNIVLKSGYDYSIGNVLNNATGYSNSLNFAMWFFFPYVIISLLSIYIFIVYDKTNKYILLGCLFLLNISTYYILSRYASFINYRCIIHIVQILRLLFPFTLGYFLYKNNIRHIKSLTACCLLILLILIKCCIKTLAFDTIYAFLFIYFWHNINLHVIIQNLFKYFGQISMYMWMTHTLFCAYFFKDYLYSIKMPILLFLALIIVSCISAIILKYISKTIITFIKI